MDRKKRTLEEENTECKEGKKAQINTSNHSGNELLSLSSIGTNSSLRLNHVPTIKTVISDLCNLQFELKRPDEFINIFGKEVIKGIKPGHCLIGNPEEEAEFYCSKAMDATSQDDGQIVDTLAEIEQVKNKETDDSSENEKTDNSSGSKIKIDGVNVHKYKETPNKLTGNTSEVLGNYKELQCGKDYIQLPGNGKQVLVWEYLGGDDWTARIVCHFALSFCI
jgi:hypothetical protein